MIIIITIIIMRPICYTVLELPPQGSVEYMWLCVPAYCAFLFFYLLYKYKYY